VLQEENHLKGRSQTRDCP